MAVRRRRGILAGMTLLPFTIDDVPATVIDLTGRGAARRVPAAPVAARPRPEPPAGADDPLYVYAGPLGPVYESYAHGEQRTYLYGGHVSGGSFALGSPRRERTASVTDRLRTGIDGTIGDRAALVRAAVDSSPNQRRLDIRVGDDRYAMVATGLFPRVGLHRADSEMIAAFTVRGRRPHRIAADASDLEVVLTVFVVRFVMRLAHLQ